MIWGLAPSQSVLQDVLDKLRLCGFQTLLHEWELTSGWVLLRSPEELCFCRQDSLEPAGSTCIFHTFMCPKPNGFASSCPRKLILLIPRNLSPLGEGKLIQFNLIQSNSVRSSWTQAWAQPYEGDWGPREEPDTLPAHDCLSPGGRKVKVHILPSIFRMAVSVFHQLPFW